MKVIVGFSVLCFGFFGCSSSEDGSDCSTSAYVKWGAQPAECKTTKVTRTELGAHERFVVLLPGANSQDQGLTVDTSVYQAGLLKPGSYANSASTTGPYIQYSAPVPITSIPSASVTIEALDRAAKTISGTFSVVLQVDTSTGVQSIPVTGGFKNASF
jgi:hypothetical protein